LFYRKTEGGNKTKRWLYLLLLPYLGLLAPVLYARSGPELFGFPFFYWYQFAWVPVTALVIGIVYWRVR
jgi:hypothetical protein